MIPVQLHPDRYFDFEYTGVTNIFRQNHGLREFLSIRPSTEIRNALILLSPDIFPNSLIGFYTDILLIPTFHHMFYNCKIQPSGITVRRRYNTIAYYIEVFDNHPHLEIFESMHYATIRVHENFVLGLFVLLSLNSSSDYIVDWEGFEDVIWCRIPFKHLLHPATIYTVLLTSTW